MDEKLMQDDMRAFLEDAYVVFGSYFTNREAFEAQCNLISNLEEKYKFLRLSTIYRILVKDGKFEVNREIRSSPNFINYYDTTYKLVALCAIIEAANSKEEFVEFKDWLIQRNQFPINNKSEINQLFIEYKSDNGATKKFVNFFKENLTEEENQFLTTKVKIHDGRGNIDGSIKQIANWLYNIRSKFVHETILSIFFHGYVLDMSDVSNRYRYLDVGLQFEQLMRIFERAFLRQFNITWNRDIGLY